VAEIRVTRIGNDLKVIFLNSPADSLTVRDYFTNTSGIEGFVFADGTVGDRNAVAALLAQGSPMDDVIDATNAQPHLFGDAGDDTLTGNAAANWLRGGAGDDALYGNAGDDRLEGGTGNDTLEGGTGSDSYVFNRGDGHDTVWEANSATIDAVYFGAGITVAEIRVTRIGNDLKVLFLNSPADSLTVRDYFTNTSGIEGFVFADGTVGDRNAVAALLAQGSPMDDVIDATNAQPHLFGDAGDDTLTGNAASNWLRGGAGNDTLTGGRNADRLEGGTGDDRYVFRTGDGSDVIRESGGDDLISFEGVDFAALRAVFRQEDDLVLDYGATDRVTVEDWFADEGCQAERFEFADVTLTGVDLLELHGLL
jgi:Ca2+-binding RTX toxin-like protein